mmetsp:Transcript_9998/g.10093  ORF Transcript_9998/g.10093 Transcript_9998/m.10093 type:complete len:98 (-) Transcript_9998:220-513(-)
MESIISTTKWIQKNSIIAAEYGKLSGLWIYTNARFIGWMIATTGMITMLPLMFEVKREAALEELEKVHISQGLAEGRTPQELGNTGMTSAIPPSVLD